MRFSRSQQAAARYCKRNMYLQYLKDGIGYVPTAMNVAQSTGILAHDIITTAIRSTVDYAIPSPSLVQNVCENKVNEFVKDVAERGYDNVADVNAQSALATGLAKGWLSYRLPIILKDHRIIAVEQEWIVPVGDHEMMQRHDFVMEREDGELKGLELKTTGIMNDSYIESWRYSQQMLTQLYGIEKHYDRIPLSVQVEFLYKGVRRDNIYYSPWTRVWKHKDGAISYQAQRGKEWTAINGWEVKEDPPLDVIAGYYGYIEIMRNQREMDIWLRQTLYELDDWLGGIEWIADGHDKEVEETATASYFPARMDEQCARNAYGQRCPYLPVCYGLIDNIADSAQYMKRTPHHTTERNDE